jgi:hypothetical protein
LEPGEALLWDRRSAAVQRVRTIIGTEADESLSASESRKRVKARSSGARISNST